MSQKSGRLESSSERVVKDIRRATRRHHSAEEKIRIVLDGLRGEHSIAEICRRKGIAESLYLLQLVEGVPRGWQAPAGGRYGACRDEQRGQGSSAPGAGVEGGRRRAGGPASTPLKPTGSKLFGTTASCGGAGFNYNPLSAADTVTSVEPSLGLMAVCATRSRLISCSDSMDVTLRT